MKKLSYDHIGYAGYRGCWIRKIDYPAPYGAQWLVVFGDHPHDPDGDNITIATGLASEVEAIKKAKEYLLDYHKRQILEIELEA